MKSRSELVKCAKAIYATLLELPNGAPSGHLYAALLGNLSFDEYQTCIAVLKEIGLIEESNFVLTAKKIPNPKKAV